MNNDYVIGIDQGASKTRVAFAKSDGTILGFGVEKGAAYEENGMDMQAEQLKVGIDNVIGKFQVAYSQLAVIAGGLTGIDFEGEEKRFEDYVKNMGITGIVHFENDVIATMKSGGSHHFGAAICCGSAANCVVVAPDGYKFVYGYLLESELYGASAIRRRAIVAAIQDDTGRIPHTMLTEYVLEKYNQPSVLALVQAFVEGEVGEKDVHDLPVVVSKCACAGDAAALEILYDLGKELGKAVHAKACAFQMQEIAFHVVLAGSIFKGPGTHLEDAITAEVLAVCPKAIVRRSRFEPVVGGVVMALEQLHGTLSQEIMANINKSAEKLGLIVP